MEILMSLSYFCAIVVISTAQHDGKRFLGHDYLYVYIYFFCLLAPPCSDEMPCQARGFLCAVDNRCIPTGDLLTLYPSLQPRLHDSHVSENSSHRTKRGTEPSDEDGRLSSDVYDECLIFSSQSRIIVVHGK